MQRIPFWIGLAFALAPYLGLVGLFVVPYVLGQSVRTSIQGFVYGLGLLWVAQFVFLLVVAGVAYSFGGRGFGKGLLIGLGAGALLIPATCFGTVGIYHRVCPSPPFTC